MNCHRRLKHRQKGAVAIIVGLSIFVLVGFLGLVVDVGRMYIIKTELANAADACSLAAAAQLTGVAANQLDLGESAGITVGQRNKVSFQGSNVEIPTDSAVTFSDHLNGTYLTKTAVAPANALSMKYAKCTLPITDTIAGGIIPYFMQVMGFGAQTVASHAVATLDPGITTCGVPLGLCQQTTPPPSTCPHGQTVDAYGLCVNEWYCSKFTAGNSTPCVGSGSTGNFNIVNYNLPGGANTLTDLLTGSGQCSLTTGIQTGQTGAVQSLSDAWNTRFGLTKPGSTGTPDFTGYSYTKAPAPGSKAPAPGSESPNWTLGYNAFSGSVAGVDNFQTARGKNTPYQGDSNPGGIGNPGTSGSKNSTQPQLANFGADRRIVVVPIVECDEWAGGQKATIRKFACVLMLHPWGAPGDPLYLEYLGTSDLPGSPCATLGLPGGSRSVGPKVPTLVR